MSNIPNKADLDKIRINIAILIDQMSDYHKQLMKSGLELYEMSLVTQAIRLRKNTLKISKIQTDIELLNSKLLINEK